MGIDLIKNFPFRVAASKHEEFSLEAPEKEGAKRIGKEMLGFGDYANKNRQKVLGNAWYFLEITWRQQATQGLGLLAGNTGGELLHSVGAPLYCHIIC